MSNNNNNNTTTTTLLYIHLDNPVVLAGQTVHGKVGVSRDLALGHDSSPFERLLLTLEGWEEIQYPHRDTKKPVSQKHTLVKLPWTVVHWTSHSPEKDANTPTTTTTTTTTTAKPQSDWQHDEDDDEYIYYPFQQQIPDSLPSSLEYTHTDHQSSQISIRYSLTACLVPNAPRRALPMTQTTRTTHDESNHNNNNNNHKKEDSWLYTTQQPLVVVAVGTTPPSRPPSYPLLVPKQACSIVTNLLFSKGTLHLGWSTPSPILYRPQSSTLVTNSNNKHHHPLPDNKNLTITIRGENCSQVDVRNFQVRLVEVITLYPHNNNHYHQPEEENDDEIRTLERLLAVQDVPVSQDRQWMANNPGAVMAPPTTVTLPLPSSPHEWHSDYFDSLSKHTTTPSSLFSIHHVVQVLAETAADRTTNPRVSHSLAVVDLVAPNETEMPYEDIIPMAPPS